MFQQVHPIQTNWSGPGSLPSQPLNRKRSAPFADSDQEEADDEMFASIKKQRTGPMTADYTQTPPLSTSLPSSAPFISPPVTPNPLPLYGRQTSDIAMEDLDMIDSAPSSQRAWPSSLNTANLPPSFAAQDSNLSAISMLDDDDDRSTAFGSNINEGGAGIRRPHTPGMIMKDMTRLEVSPSSENHHNNRAWLGMDSVHAAAVGSTAAIAIPGLVGVVGLEQQQSSSGVHAKGRFTMGYRADCEKCRMRVPGHYTHLPGF